MTKEEFEQNYPRKSMPCPFANSGDVAIIGATSTASDFNFPQGFNTPYSAPNGKYVTRDEINAIGNIATHNQFVKLCGGINTFDAAFADAIGGYPKGALLDFYGNGYYNKVVSLVDNNKVDFISEGIDNVNWMLVQSTNNESFSDGATPWVEKDFNAPYGYWEATPFLVATAPTGGDLHVDVTGAYGAVESKTFPTQTVPCTLVRGLGVAALDITGSSGGEAQVVSIGSEGTTAGLFYCPTGTKMAVINSPGYAWGDWGVTSSGTRVFGVPYFAADKTKAVIPSNIKIVAGHTYVFYVFNGVFEPDAGSVSSGKVLVTFKVAPFTGRISLRIGG